MFKLVQRFWYDEKGQGLSEYALLLGLIVVAVVVIIKGMGGHIKSIFAKANNQLANADT
jgi:pilus assembly protein Flp/PilA